jgi:hypothetical protein
VQPLKVAGVAKLGGKLQVAPPDGSIPAGGRKWTVLAVEGGISGQFDQITEGYKASIVGNGKELAVQRLAN